MGKKSRGNGEGTIYKREIHGKTKWCAEYTLQYCDRNGKRKKKTIFGDTRQEVKEKLEQLIVELGTNTYVDKSSTKFIDIATSIVDDGYRLNKLSDSSYKRKKETLKQIQKHYMAEMELQKITEYDVKDFLSYITKYSNSVIGKIYGLVNNTFKRAIRKNIIKYNFLDDKLEFFKPTSSRKDKKVRAFTVEEQKKFLDVVLNVDNKVKYKHQLLLSMYSGMRMGEINALDVDDVDFDNNIIHVRRTLTKSKDDKTIMGDKTKTNHGERDIVMDEQVRYILKDYMDNYYKENKEHVIFYNDKKDTFWTASQINMVFKRLCEKYDIGIGYDVNQHMLRHTFATRCIESGMPANVLQKIMGHHDLRTTLEVYCDVFANYEKQHSVQTYDYLKENGLLLKDVKQKENTMPKEELQKIINKLNDMYEKQDDKLIKILKMVA